MYVSYILIAHYILTFRFFNVSCANYTYIFFETLYTTFHSYITISWYKYFQKNQEIEEFFLYQFSIRFSWFFYNFFEIIFSYFWKILSKSWNFFLCVCKFIVQNCQIRLCCIQIFVSKKLLNMIYVCLISQ